LALRILVATLLRLTTALVRVALTEIAAETTTTATASTMTTTATATEIILPTLPLLLRVTRLVWSAVFARLIRAVIPPLTLFRIVSRRAQALIWAIVPALLVWRTLVAIFAWLARFRAVRLSALTLVWTRFAALVVLRTRLARFTEFPLFATLLAELTRLL
jgi:hypothetical protein